MKHNLRKLSEKKATYVTKTIYSCPCGRGTIEEEQDYTPGHRDGIAFLCCHNCQDDYFIDFGSSQTKWSLRKKEKKGMDNLWLLTEERPKLSVVLRILDEYNNDFGATVTVNENFNIRPIVKNGKFTFEYLVEGVSVQGIANVFIEIVSGNSSFVDYMLIRQEAKPADHSLDNVLMAIEETKTSDAESRNTGIYQRASKFVYIDNYCPRAKKYMLYNEEMTPDEDRTPTDTNRFGTNMLLTLGVKFIGKTMRGFKAFANVDEMVAQKSSMRLPNHTNVPILLHKYADRITVSGRLAKPKDAGNIGHDPNIGALSCIGYTLRKLGWDRDIVVTHHGVSQSYVDKTRGRNKCLFLFSMNHMKLDGITMPPIVPMPEFYWNYSCSSEKVASIFLHLTCQYSGIHGIYENHAGCERGYFRTRTGAFLALPKKDRYGENLLLPDVVLCDDTIREIYNVEGKKLSTLYDGVAEVDTYDSIEDEFIKPHYRGYSIQRWVSIFGGNLRRIPHEKVLVYLNESGEVYINNAAPANIKTAFNRIGITC